MINLNRKTLEAVRDYYRERMKDTTKVVNELSRNRSDYVKQIRKINEQLEGKND